MVFEGRQSNAGARVEGKAAAAAAAHGPPLVSTLRSEVLNRNRFSVSTLKAQPPPPKPSDRVTVGCPLVTKEVYCVR